MKAQLKSRWASVAAVGAGLALSTAVGSEQGRAGGPQRKIIGGEDAVPGEFPYVAALLTRGEPNAFDAQFCGGTVIHPHWVVTAAHCVEGETPSTLDVLVGTQDLANPGAAQRIPVADIITFPGYDSATLDSDIALLLLAQPVTGLATFPKLATDPASFAAGVTSTVLGWGASTPAEDTYPERLQKVDLPLVARSTAEPFYALDDLVLTDNMIFAGFAAGGKDSCGGDSGGPLLVPDGGGGHLLAGVVSFGRNIDCAAPGNYGAYTKVANFASWVRSITSPNIFAWESLHAASVSGPDTDRDGAGAFLEFSAWTDPNSGSSLPFPASGSVEIAGQRYPTMTFRRLIGPSEVRYGMDSASSLAGWLEQNTTALQVGAPQAVPGQPHLEAVTLRGPSPVMPGSSGFLRLRVSPSHLYVPGVREFTVPGFVSGGLSVLEAPLTGGRYVKRYRLGGYSPGVALTLTLRSGQFDAGLSVIDEATGALIAEDTGNAGGGTDDKVTFTPQPGVSHLVLVTSDTPGGIGDFTLAVPSPPAALPEISGNGTTSGRLDATDPVDPIFEPGTYYKDDYRLTNAPLGTRVVLRMASAEFDAYIEIVNAETGALVVDDDDSGPGTDSFLDYVVDTSAPLLIRATSALEFETGAYTITRSSTP